VRLDVRPQRQMVRGCVRGRTIEITGESVEVDYRNRGLEVGSRQRHPAKSSLRGDDK
jgi:hypothetical protein